MPVISPSGRMKENPELGASLGCIMTPRPKTITTKKLKDFHGKGYDKDGAQLQTPADAQLPLHAAEGDPAHSM